MSASRGRNGLTVLTATLAICGALAGVYVGSKTCQSSRVRASLLAGACLQPPSGAAHPAASRYLHLLQHAPVWETAPRIHPQNKLSKPPASISCTQSFHALHSCGHRSLANGVVQQQDALAAAARVQGASATHAGAAGAAAAPFGFTQVAGGADAGAPCIQPMDPNWPQTIGNHRQKVWSQVRERAGVRAGR